MLKTIVIFIIALLGFGMIRLPLQNHILEQEKAEGLLDNPVELSSSDYLEQQLAMVSLGGLRSLVAAVLSMEAFDCFLISDWANLERRYNQVTALAPHSDFYWDNGSWHLGNNASSSYLDNKRLSPMERREGFRKYIQKGRRFLEKASTPILTAGTFNLCWATCIAIPTGNRTLKRRRKPTARHGIWERLPLRPAKNFMRSSVCLPNPEKLWNWAGSYSRIPATGHPAW